MNYWSALALLFCGAAFTDASSPYEDNKISTPVSGIDMSVLSQLAKHNIKAASLCSDAVFIRRVYLDIIGTIPEPGEVTRFLADKRKYKRSVLIDKLLSDDRFADYWALKWCDTLRVKAEYPINLWPNGVQTYYRWIHTALRDNMAYDEFARSLLTTSGSNFRVAPANFYRAVSGRKPEDLAAAVALTFMGTQTEHWTPEQRAGLAVFFSQVMYKKTSEWKEEIVLNNPAPRESLVGTFPDGTTVSIAPEQDPRMFFADWLMTKDNPWFARCICNRVWAWLTGRGIIHKPDDIRADNPPSNPELLDYLEKRFVASGYDLRKLYRLILNSATYQQSPVPRSKHPKAAELNAHYLVRPLEAEVLIDTLCWISGKRINYSSAIPEPFTFVPDNQRTIELADGSITSQFLDTFGRPSRDTGKFDERGSEPTSAQRLFMLNSTEIQNGLKTSQRLKRIIAKKRGKPGKVVQDIYLTLLSRPPTQEELKVALAYVKGKKQRGQAVYDLAWALMNTKEFLYRH